MSRLTATAGPGGPGRPSGRGAANGLPDWPAARWLRMAQKCAAQSATVPFDNARRLYTIAAQTGLIQKSMLANRDFERALSAMERITLGPWARRV